MKNKQPSYGIDAPRVVRNLILGGFIIILLGTIFGHLLKTYNFTFALIVLIWGSVSGFMMIVTAGLMIFSSKIGKLKVRDHLVDSLNIKGNENVLDLGCGSGLLLIAVLKKIKHGKVTGIDLWQEEDQSGNTEEMLKVNIEIENLSSKAEIITGDIRELPFKNNHFDLIVSSLAIHNIPYSSERKKVFTEINRVLKKGGNIVILDFQFTKEYLGFLKELGWNNVELSKVNYNMFPPVRVLYGSKN